MVIPTEDKQQAGWQWQVFPGEQDYGALHDSSSEMVQEIKALFQEAEHRQEQRIGSLIQRVEHNQNHVLTALFNSARTTQEEHFKALLQRAETSYREQMSSLVEDSLQSVLRQAWRRQQDEQKAIAEESERRSELRQRAVLEDFLQRVEDRNEDQLRELFGAWHNHILRQQEEADQQEEVQRVQHNLLYAQHLQVQQQLKELHAVQQAQAEQLRGQLDSINRTTLQLHNWLAALVANCGPASSVEEVPDCQDDAQDDDGEVNSEDCLLRRMRLGLVSPQDLEMSETHTERRRRRPLRKAPYVDNCPKDADGYLADDESSLCSHESDIGSVASVSLWDERRELVLAVRRLRHVRPPTRYRYRPSWTPFRCYRCRRTGHVAVVCDAKRPYAPRVSAV